MISGRLARLSTRERSWMLIAGVFVVLLCVVLLVVNPVLQELHRLEEEIGRKRVQKAYARSVESWHAGVAQQFSAAAGRLSKAVSPSEDIAEFKGEIDELARKHSLVVSTMEHREPRPFKAYDEYTVAIGKFESSRQALLEFLDDLQKSPGLLRVSNMSLTPGLTGDQIKGSLLITKVKLKNEKAGVEPAVKPGR
jgi:type II secretory pathway component PulM